MPAAPDSTPITYAVGDIHGSLSKLRGLISRCEQHANGRSMTLVFLGDYIDRGPQSCGVIDCLIDLWSRLGDRVITLQGNHEGMLLEVIDGTMPNEFWLLQGGADTLRSYGIDDPRELPRQHVDWLRTLRLSYDDGRRLFVHAGIDPERPLHAQTAHDMVWIREPFLSDERDHGRLIVHGHTPVRTGTPDVRGNRVNLDTGAVFGGPLTAGVFASGQTPPIAFLQAR